MFRITFLLKDDYDNTPAVISRTSKSCDPIEVLKELGETCVLDYKGNYRVIKNGVITDEYYQLDSIQRISEIGTTRSQENAEACYNKETGEFNWDLYAQLCEMPFCDD